MPSSRKDRRNTGPVVEVKTKLKDDEKWFNQFVGKIEFYNFGFIGATMDSKSTRFRVFIKKRVSFKKIKPIIESAFKGCRVKPYMRYSFTSTYDVRLPVPITWKEFKLKTVKAIGRYL